MARVHLTFDNGPHPEGTPLVLQVLEAHSYTATFFVLGKHLATSEGRALAERCVAAGHRLGHHSWSHTTPLGDDLDPGAVDRELEDTHTLLRGVWDGPRWFRPFGGGGVLGPHLFSPGAVQWLRDQAYTAVLWNSVPGDWKDPDGWVDVALADADRLDDVVVVLHDVVPAAMRHLDRFLVALRERGHTIAHHWPASVTPIVEGRAGPGLVGMVRRPSA